MKLISNESIDIAYISILIKRNAFQKNRKRTLLQSITEAQLNIIKNIAHQTAIQSKLFPSGFKHSLIKINQIWKSN